MHSGATLDVRNIVDRLAGAGVPPDQARSHATVLADVISNERRWMDARYLPRDDLAGALAPLKSAIQAVDAKVDRLAIETNATAERLSAESKSTAESLSAESKATAERLELKIDKTSADLRSEIMKSTLSVWFLQFGFFVALLFKVTT